MKRYRQSLLLLCVCLLFVGCASSSKEEMMRQEQAAAEEAARLEAARMEEERQRALQEQRAREAELARQAEEARRAEELARQEAEKARQRAEEEKRQQEARARELARKQERLKELEAQVAKTKASTETMEGANLKMQDAVVTAEALLDALTSERAKYESLDPETGETTRALSKARIADLEAQLERLKQEASELAAQAR